MVSILQLWTDNRSISTRCPEVGINFQITNDPCATVKWLPLSCAHEQCSSVSFLPLDYLSGKTSLFIYHLSEVLKVLVRLEGRSFARLGTLLNLYINPLIKWITNSSVQNLFGTRNPNAPTRWLYKSQRNHAVTPPLLADIISALILIKSVIQPNILTYILIRIRRAHEGVGPTQYAILITYPRSHSGCWIFQYSVKWYYIL